VRYLWEDLTKPVAGLSGLDWIVMNPPFHEGKKTDSGIGADFINTAAVALRSGGTLYMVANANLPYEESIRKNFSDSKKILEGEGFKVLSAVR
jgi:16S rRNA (guanine1207-N2)-methyltransferase